MKKFTLFFSMLILGTTIVAQPWHWINPANGHHHLNDISFITPGNGIAVADNGVILHYNDSIWTQAESPVSVNLNAVKYLSPTLAWAVGDNGAILKYNGSDWVQQESPVTVTLNDVCFTEETHGWAVGNTILFYDGNTWQVQLETGGLKTVSFYTPDEGWAGSSSANLYHFMNGDWIPDNTFINGNLLSFNKIEMTGPTTVRMIGNDIDGAGVFYENTGSGWQLQSSEGVNSSISFTDHLHGFGIENKGPFVYNTYPAIHKFTNGEWVPEYTAKMKNMLTSVESISENEAFATDSIGFIYHGLDGNWGVSNGFTPDSILDISFTRANNGYFACGAGGIWHYDAGNWTNVLKVPGFRFNQIVFSDENYGWAAAFKEVELPSPFNYESKLFRYINGVWTEIVISEFIDIWSPVSSLEIISTDLGFTFHNSLYSLNGNNWDFFELPLNDSITQLVYMEPYPIVSPRQGDRQDWEAAWMSVKRLEGDTLGVIYYNNFMENNWEITYGTSTGSFNDLCISDYMNVYAVGDNGLIAYFNGQSWMEFPPVTSEDLLSVYINDGNEGWATGENGTLLKYNGLSWSVVQSHTWNDLFKITVLQNGLGLVGGGNGTLLCTQPQLPVGNSYSIVGNTKDVLIIFPNPAQNYALVQFNLLGDSPVELNITDLTGRLVFEKSITTTGSGIQTVPVNLQHMKDGIYLIQVRSGGKLLTGKVLIQK